MLKQDPSTYEYEYDLSGYFHPGQTNTSHPNSAGGIGYSGAYLRDWRIDRKFDYAVVFVDDTWESVNLGWLNPAYFTNSTSYHGVNTRLLGYPKKTDDCLASPLANKNCDGWMYRDQDLLDPLSTAIDGQLRYDIDSQGGQSGSAVFTSLDNSWVILGVHWGHTPSDPNYNRAARFRDQMWNDVCEWVESFPTNKVFYNCG